MAETQKVFTVRSIILMVLVVLVFPFLPMIISGRWDWWQAWAYAILSIVGFVASRGLAARRHADIITERARSIELQGAKPWDKVLAPMLAFGSLLLLGVAGLERLYGWSGGNSTADHILALVLLFFGYVLSSWALIENRFFSGVVRIQMDRGHQVVTTGPYRFIRHPGYAGALLVYVSIPVLLDSVFAFIPTLLLGIVLMLRTFLEDQTLQAELPGYKEYAQKTRYRLIPGMW